MTAPTACAIVESPADPVADLIAEAVAITSRDFECTPALALRFLSEVMSAAAEMMLVRRIDLL